MCGPGPSDQPSIVGTEAHAHVTRFAPHGKLERGAQPRETPKVENRISFQYRGQPAAVGAKRDSSGKVREGQILDRSARIFERADQQFVVRETGTADPLAVRAKSCGRNLWLPRAVGSAVRSAMVHKRAC